MRVFLDTNVLVAAFATRGLCADLLRRVLARHDLVVTREVLDELGPVLDRRIGLGKERTGEILAFLGRWLVEAGEERRIPSFELRDPSDVPVVGSAIAAGAEILVSGDRDLLAASLPLPVVSPRGFWELEKGDGPAGAVHEPERR